MHKSTFLTHKTVWCIQLIHSYECNTLQFSTRLLFNDGSSGGGGGGNSDGDSNGIVTIIFGYRVQCGLQLFWFFESITWHRTHFCTQSIPGLRCCVMWCGLILWDAANIIFPELCVPVCVCVWVLGWYDFIFLFIGFRTNSMIEREESERERDPFKLFNKIVAKKGGRAHAFVLLNFIRWRIIIPQIHFVQFTFNHGLLSSFFVDGLLNLYANGMNTACLELYCRCCCCYCWILWHKEFMENTKS